MFYQNNNDYMRDAFYYSQPQNSTYQYGNGYNINQMPNQFGMNGMQQNSTMLPRSNMQNTNVQQMYPPIYRIIDPVACRVISNNNTQYVTEDSLNNMVNTVYDIVEGDISTLSSGNPGISDDTVTQGPTTNRDTITNTTTTQNSRTTQISRTTTSQRDGTVMPVNANVSNGDNQLLRDLIKIIIIKEIISRQNMFGNNMSNYNNSQNNMCYDPRCYGMI